jgi:hypothetical protein
LLAAVAIGIAGNHALDAVPGRAHRLLGIGPGQLRFALGDVPARLEARLEILEARVRILFVRLVRIEIRWVEVFPAVFLSVVRLVLEVALPMSGEPFDAILVFHGDLLLLEGRDAAVDPYSADAA